jgi:hypothetical protein
METEFQLEMMTKFWRSVILMVHNNMSELNVTVCALRNCTNGVHILGLRN